MKRRLSGRRLITGLIIAVVLLGLFWPVRFLSVTDRETEKGLLKLEVVEGESLIYSYIHSVSGTEIREYIRVDEEDLITFKVMYKDQSGAGLPEYIDEGAVFSQVDGWMVIEGLERVVSPMQIHVSEVYQNRIQVGDMDFLLSDRFRNAKGSVRVEVRTVPYIVYIMSRSY